MPNFKKTEDELVTAHDKWLYVLKKFSNPSQSLWKGLAFLIDVTATIFRI
jgi:hypothetical protein